jgi:lysophospholipase L1-like esterase
MAWSRAVALPLAPVLLWQGRRVRRDTPKLPEAAGPRHGLVKPQNGPLNPQHGQVNPIHPVADPLRLLILGDSSAAGVGTDRQATALSGRLVDGLVARTGRAVQWKLVARTGITTREALALMQAEPADPFDVAVVALGVNDVTALRGRARWLADVARVTARLAERHAVQRVVWSGLPPMHLFPALPQPLRGVIGLHARVFDGALGDWCARRTARASVADPGSDVARASTVYVPLPRMTDPSLIASDGFHPGPGAYRLWGDVLAECIAGQAG